MTTGVFRRATPDDFDALVAIGHKFFAFNIYRNHTSLNEESLRRTLWDLFYNHVMEVIEIEGKIIGVAAAFIAPLYWNHNFLQGLEAFWWIDPEYRKEKFGTLLRHNLQQAAVERGVRFWNMIALKESMHDEVCASYEKAGMTHVETVYMKVL